MKKILAILICLLLAASAVAQDLPLTQKQWYGIGVIGEAPETSSYNSITDQTAYLTGLVNAAGNTCFAGANAATCFMYVGLSGALGAISTKAMDGTAIPITDIGIETLAGNYFWNLNTPAFEAWQGQPLNVDSISQATPAPYVGSFLYGYDVSNTEWDRLTLHPAGDSLSATQAGLDVLSHNLFYDGSNYRRWQGITAADNLTLPVAPHVLSTMMAYDGATLDMLKVGSVGELEVTDVATRPGEDAGNDWRKVKKESVATYSPAKETTTGVGTAATTVLASKEMLDWPNWCIWLENDDGADPFVDADVQVSPDDSAWVSLTWTSCDALAAGGQCVYCVTNAAYRYVRVQVAAADANQVDVDAWITANTN